MHQALLLAAFTSVATALGGFLAVKVHDRTHIILGPAAPAQEHLIFSGKFSLVNPTAGALKANRSLLAQTIWFTTPSGSATFVAGINYWPCEVSYTCPEGVVGDQTRILLQSITSQVLTLWQTKAVGMNLK